MNFFSNLFKMVKKLGGDEQSVYDFFSSPNGVKEVAELIVLKIKNSIQSLSGFISPLKLNWVNDSITETNFPVQPEDNIPEKEYKVFHFGRSISSKDVIKEMEKAMAQYYGIY